MFFSIIIPACNRPALLQQCLNRLLPGQQTFNEGDYEIIVTDDSTDILVEYMVSKKYPTVKYLIGPKKGPAANRNNGAKQAQGEWLVFLDDDCLPDKGLIKNYQKAIAQHPPSLVFEGRISADRQKARMDEEAPINETGGLLWSCNFMVKKNLFEIMGGFNENFGFAAMEDVEFRKRVETRTDMKFIYDAFVIHPWRIVPNSAIKFQKVLQAHKTYINLHPNDKQFKAINIAKLLLISFFKNTLPSIFKYRGNGLQYPVQFHWFQIKLLKHVLFKNANA